MKKFRVGLDVDGILADFNTGYWRVLRSLTGHDGTLPSVDHIDTWYWPRKFGYTKEDEDKAWEVINADPTFWMKLPPYLETSAALGCATILYQEGHEVFFITNRTGVHPHFQTLAFLLGHGHTGLPQVIISGSAESKGEIAKALGLTHYIDDRAENAIAVKEMSPLTEMFVMRRGWNDHPHYNTRFAELGITVVTSLKDMFDHLVREEAAHAIVV